MNLRSIVTSITVIAVLSFSLLATAQEEGQPDMVKLVEDVRAVAGEAGGEPHRPGRGVDRHQRPGTGERSCSIRCMHRPRRCTPSSRRTARSGPRWSRRWRCGTRRRAQYLEKSETNAAFKAIADEWELKVEQAGELRKQILTQRAESLALLDHIRRGAGDRARLFRAGAGRSGAGDHAAGQRRAWAHERLDARDGGADKGGRRRSHSRVSRYPTPRRPRKG